MSPWRCTLVRAAWGMGHRTCSRSADVRAPICPPLSPITDLNLYADMAGITHQFPDIF